MDIYEVGNVAGQARRYGLRCETPRIGKGEDDEYSIKFGKGLVFTDGRAASMFVEAMIREHKLSEINKPYRVAFGWEIF